MGLGAPISLHYCACWVERKALIVNVGLHTLGSFLPLLVAKIYSIIEKKELSMVETIRH